MKRWILLDVFVKIVITSNDMACFLCRKGTWIIVPCRKGISVEEVKGLINELAQDIIRIFEIDVPIRDIDEVVGKMGGKIIKVASMPIDKEGAISKSDDGNGFIIYVSKFQSDVQRKFTVAHELGHLFLHMGYLTDTEKWNECCEKKFYRSRKATDLEYQANEFAAALLMPQELYREEMERNTNGTTVNTTAIADYFGVSVSAASYRGKFLGLLKW